MSVARPALLFGASGQIGSALSAQWPSHVPLVIPHRAQADFRNPAGIRELVIDLAPSVVINAAGYTAVDMAEDDEATALCVNAETPAAIAAAAREVSARLIHFSTDYVYDGAATKPYVETDTTNPLSAYGRTKLRGDESIIASGASYLILRTSWVYAARGRNFLHAILKRARDTGHLRVVNDQTGAPTSASAIAGAILSLIDRGDVESGVYHLTAAGCTTWYDFARAILDRAAVTAVVEPISTAEFGAPAIRPRYSVLDNTKVSEILGREMPSWESQLDAVLGDPVFLR